MMLYIVTNGSLGSIEIWDEESTALKVADAYGSDYYVIHEPLNYTSRLQDDDFPDVDEHQEQEDFAHDDRDFGDEVD